MVRCLYISFAFATDTLFQTMKKFIRPRYVLGCLRGSFGLQLTILQTCDTIFATASRGDDGSVVRVFARDLTRACQPLLTTTCL